VVWGTPCPAKVACKDTGFLAGLGWSLQKSSSRRRNTKFSVQSEQNYEAIFNAP
jgi:hypothetical protein